LQLLAVYGALFVVLLKQKVSVTTVGEKEILLTFGSLLIVGVLKLAMVDTPLLAVQRCAFSDCEASRSDIREDIVIIVMVTVCPEKELPAKDAL
jgi:hypothetical protein